MPELTIKITSISRPIGAPGSNREPSFISVQVTGDGVTIEAGDIMISNEDADRLTTAIKRWKATQGILEDPIECKRNLSPSEWQQAYLGHWDDKEQES